MKGERLEIGGDEREDDRYGSNGSDRAGEDEEKEKEKEEKDEVDIDRSSRRSRGDILPIPAAMMPETDR